MDFDNSPFKIFQKTNDARSFLFCEEDFIKSCTDFFKHYNLSISGAKVMGSLRNQTLAFLNEVFFFNIKPLNFNNVVISDDGMKKIARLLVDNVGYANLTYRDFDFMLACFIFEDEYEPKKLESDYNYRLNGFLSDSKFQSMLLNFFVTKNKPNELMYKFLEEDYICLKKKDIINNLSSILLVNGKDVNCFFDYLDVLSKNEKFRKSLYFDKTACIKIIEKSLEECSSNGIVVEAMSYKDLLSRARLSKKSLRGIIEKDLIEIEPFINSTSVKQSVENLKLAVNYLDLENNIDIKNIKKKIKI